MLDTQGYYYYVTVTNSSSNWSEAPLARGENRIWSWSSIYRELEYTCHWLLVALLVDIRCAVGKTRGLERLSGLATAIEAKF